MTARATPAIAFAIARTIAVGVAGVAVIACARTLGAQTRTVVIDGPAGSVITDAVGTFTITTSGFQPADLPLRLQLQVATNPAFTPPLFADTTVSANNATITIPRLLPQRVPLYWRAFALTALSGSVPSATTGPRNGPVHLRLVSPNNPAGQSLSTRTPRFVWSSSHVDPLIGPWEYELRIEETATARTRLIVSTPDTAVTIADALEANASYRWRVTARLKSIPDSVTVSSAASFVVTSADAPPTTVVFAPFPSPFPSSANARMCLWFDLAQPAPVTIDVLDPRGLLVRRLAPGGDIPATLPAGRYGRASPDATSGCDDRFSWDGTDAQHRNVPPGVYLIVVRAPGFVARKPVVFAGR